MIRAQAAFGVGAMAALLSPSLLAQESFQNFETPQVTPMSLSPSGDWLFVVNTADARLEVFDLTGPAPRWAKSISVGLEPVSARARTDNEIWVVNHLSDTISVVDLNAGATVRTLPTANEPTDVVFAGAAGRAFVTCSFANQVLVFNPADLAAAPVVIPIAGEDPRALAVSADGSRVYAAIFESGNNTTVIDEDRVSDPTGPYGGVNPPPNDGVGFYPPINPNVPPPPLSTLILKRDRQANVWMDDNGGVWPSSIVPWDVHDHDVAVIDANSLGVSYVTGLMNALMAIATRSDGKIAVVGTDAINHVRFEPNITGVFVQSLIALVDPANPTTPEIVDLNPHLANAYAMGVGTVEQAQRDLSLADPRGVAWHSDGALGLVTGMGSNNVVFVDADGGRVQEIDVGEGPTGVVLDEPRNRAYVLNRFEATISVIDLPTRTEVSRVGIFDPTPDVIRAGRPFLYNATRTSGLGVTACGSCHIDGRMDQLGWDLGDPSATIKAFNQSCQLNLGGACEDFHPMKGPMVTQTLQGIVGVEPLHWRGDREDLAAFNPAFVSLLGDDTELTPEEMDAFEGFISTIKFEPNRNRTVDDKLPPMVGNGNPTNGRNLFRTGRLDAGVLNCVDCHALPDGTSGQITPAGPMLSAQSMKIAHLRNLLEKEGFFQNSLENNRGFGLTHSGVTDTIDSFLRFPLFRFNTEQQRRDMIAFLRSFPNGTHAGIGRQVTMDGVSQTMPAIMQLLNLMVTTADNDEIGLIAKGRVNGVPRGFTFTNAGVFISDRAGETYTDAQLRAAASAGNEITYTLVPLGTQMRSGVDRDEDGALDQDEVELCGDPANALIRPTDIDMSGRVDIYDLALILSRFGLSSGATFADGDIDGDGDVDIEDLQFILVAYGRVCGT